MFTEELVTKINNLINKYPKKRSALISALMAVQKANENNLSKEDIIQVAEFIGISHANAFGVSTYYSMFNVNRKVGKYHLQVDMNIPAYLSGSDNILEVIKKEIDIEVGATTNDGLFTLDTVEALGSCDTTPVIQVNNVYYENMTVEKTKELISSLRKGILPEKKVEYNWGSVCNVLLKNRGAKNSTSIDTYKANSGYKGLEKALKMEPQAIIDEVKASGIRGRGGAGFPTGVKWRFIPKGTEKPIYLICNADEGEPGTFKDRQIMEYDPHLLIEGMIISARAIGSKLGFIYIRGEFSWIAEILEKAIDEARSDKKLGDFDIIVHRGAGSYVCGEETALIESIEGKRGQPRMKPPFPAVEGLYGCPTIVNNVETLASLPFIIKKGAEAFKVFGYENNYGFKLFSISGTVNKPGVYEYPLGTSFSELMEAAGGVKGKLKAAIVGGLSVTILMAEELETLKMDYGSTEEHGTSLGSGGVIVLNSEVSIPQLALRTIKFYAHESCGKCVPCKEGSYMIVKILERLISGVGTSTDIDNILRITATTNVSGATLCPTGEAFSTPISSMINKFRSEFEALVN